MTTILEEPADLLKLVGQSLGATEWMNVTQQQVDLFADATGDRQWIHTDPERAAKGPFKGTIAHGYLTLSLTPAVIAQVLEIRELTAALNHGLNKVRFPRRCESVHGSVLRSQSRARSRKPPVWNRCSRLPTRSTARNTPTTTDSADFYALEALLDDDEQDFLHSVRDFMKSEVEPSVNQHWQRGSFPLEIVPGFRQLGLAGLPYHGFGCPGRSFLLDGMVAMELARTDPSIATFAGVHGGLSMGSIYLCGSDEQKQRHLPTMARLDKIAAFGLTEPDVGSGASRGLTTTARRDGDSWILNGQKKWIGNATFGDLTVIWAKDVADGQVKGFIVANDSPGFSTTKLEDKIALRIVQNAVITLDDVRVSEDDRLQNANSFRDTAEVLRMTRAGVAWMAVGCARGAYENALAYAISREQFGRPIAGFQLVQDLLVRMLGNITSSWALCARLSQLQDEGRAEDRHSSLAKAWCTVRMRETVGYARELLGGNGILLEHNVGRFVADAEAIYSYEGTREMNTLIVGRAITGLSAFV